MVRQFAASRVCSGMLRSRFLQLMTAAVLALSGVSASAGILSVTTQQTGSTVTFKVFDSDPLDICDGGLCYADFAIGFDASKLAFLDGATTSPFFAMANAEVGGASGSQVLVSLFADEPDLAGASLLFSIGFTALVSEPVTLTVGVRDFGVTMPYQPDPINVVIPLATALSEPFPALLTAIGLAGLLAARRRKPPAAGKPSLSN